VIKINKDARKTYDNMFEVLFREYNDSHKAYDHLLQFLTVYNHMAVMDDIKFEWFFKNQDLADKLIRSYDRAMIKSDRYDYLGDIYTENVIGPREAGRTGLYLTPQPVVDAMCQMIIGETMDRLYVVDPCAGSGRFLITANKYAPNAILFGVDKNITMVRTAFTNAAIHNIDVFLLHADSLYHEINLCYPNGLYNWHHANRWQSQIDKLKPMNP